MEFAACQDTDPDLFFPVGETGAALDQIERAKAVCRLCVVQQTCLEYSLNYRMEHGIWGGMAEDERRVLLRARLPERRMAEG